MTNVTAPSRPRRRSSPAVRALPPPRELHKRRQETAAPGAISGPSPFLPGLRARRAAAVRPFRAAGGPTSRSSWGEAVGAGDLEPCQHRGHVRQALRDAGMQAGCDRVLDGGPCHSGSTVHGSPKTLPAKMPVCSLRVCPAPTATAHRPPSARSLRHPRRQRTLTEALPSPSALASPAPCPHPCRDTSALVRSGTLHPRARGDAPAGMRTASCAVARIPALARIVFSWKGACPPASWGGCC
jgi:hypothetical protein